MLLQALGGIVNGLLHSLAKDALAEVSAPHVGVPATARPAGEPRPAGGQSVALRLTVAGDRSKDLACVHIDHARGDFDHGLGFVHAEGAGAAAFQIFPPPPPAP